MKNYDLVILGGGAVGFATATVANALDADTAMINSGLPLGRTCVNVGLRADRISARCGGELVASTEPTI